MRPFFIDATIAIWDTVKRKLMPTPTKFHYTFNIRELARIFQGICNVAEEPKYKVIKSYSNVKER